MALRKFATTLHPVQPRVHDRDIDGLLQQLADPDPALRRWAARDLARHPQSVPRLAHALAVEGDASVREVLFTSLGSIGGAQAVQALLPLLRSDDAAQRNGAIEALAAMPGDVAPCIDRLLDDADADVRIFAVNLLGELRHAQVPAWLARVLRCDSQVNVVAAAIEALAEVGGADELPALEAARERFADDPFISFAAALARSRIEAA